MKTKYQTYEIKAKGNIYRVTVVAGEYNYINILKTTNNPFKKIGNDFKDFDEAIRHYKSPEMKTELLKIQTGITNLLSQSIH